EMTEDIDTKSIKAITLSYTFFKQDSDEAAVAAASSLKEQGETRQRELSQAETAEFTNHVLRPR
ncbi:MAG: cytochrome c oxidase assembly protein, partial [Parvibaculum sp.]